MKKLTYGFSTIIILVVVVLFILVFFFILKGSAPKKVNPKPTLTPMPTSVPSPNVVDTSDWKTYTNTEFKFQLRYPKEFTVRDNGPHAATSSAAAVLGRISFIDSNKNTFDVNIYPHPSGLDNNLEAVPLSLNYCGTTLVEKTIVNKMFTESGLTYKQVAQVDRSGRNLTDFCFYAPTGELIVFRNNIDSTVIAMKQILLSLLFSGQTDKNGQTLYVNSEDKFAFRYPKTYSLSMEKSDFIPPNTLGSLITVVRREGIKNEKAQFSQVANFAVSKSDDLPACFNSLTGKADLNGRDYKTGKIIEGATGHSIEALIYRTIKGKCYEIESSVQTATGSGEGLNLVTADIQKDKQTLTAELDAILKTFVIID